MRELTKKQKNLITRWVNEGKTKMPWESYWHYKIQTVQDLSPEQYAVLEGINDTEVLYQNVQRFISDIMARGQTWTKKKIVQ